MDSDAEAQRVQSFIDAGNYHAAFNIALSAMNVCRRSGDQPGIDRFLGIMKGIVLTMEKEYGGK